MKKIVLLVFVLCGAMSLSGCILPPGGPGVDLVAGRAADIFMGQACVDTLINKPPVYPWPVINESRYRSSSGQIGRY
ncbi:Uncharacterised protein [Raoultella terrigena]|uniref:Lipoprotein n=1 Tax=Raoultella terrigena TaxID=577 RepID=A0A7Z8Z9U1_RAOTE|nr:Uncharacterised protein [Raoultella terrigena]